MMKRTISTATLILASSLTLAGCGGGGGPVLEEGTFRGVFISTSDCANDADMTIEICADAIQSAIETHTQTSPTYPQMRACTATHGDYNCERNIEQKFRPRLVAYLVETFKEKPPKGTPLYGPPGKEEGFRDLAKTVYLESDLTLRFSRRAVYVYAENLSPKQREKLLR